MGKNERERRSFTFTHVQFMNLAHIFAHFKFMNVSERGSLFCARSRSFAFILRSHWQGKKGLFHTKNQLPFHFFKWDFFHKNQYYFGSQKTGSHFSYFLIQF